MKNGALSEEFRQRMLGRYHSGFSAHTDVSVAAEDIAGRKKLAGYPPSIFGMKKTSQPGRSGW